MKVIKRVRFEIVRRYDYNNYNNEHWRSNKIYDQPKLGNFSDS